MNIILYVDFKSKEINSDFALSNALISEHTVLLVTNEVQLEDSYKVYDLVLVGKSAFNVQINKYKKILRVEPDWDNQRVMSEIDKL